MTSRFEIRDATEEDLPGIAAVHTRSWQAAYRGTVPDGVLDNLDVEARLRSWRSFVAGTSPLELLVARDPRGVIGFAAAGQSRDQDAGSETGELFAIYVDPDHWGQGAGSGLLKTIQNRLADAGFQRATLWVLRDNDRTRSFYERHGWQAEGATKENDRGDFVLHEVRYARPFTTHV